MFFYVAQTVFEVANIESDAKNRYSPYTPLRQQPATKFLGLISIPCANIMWLIVQLLTYIYPHIPSHILDIYPLLVQILCGSLSKCLPSVTKRGSSKYCVAHCPNAYHRYQATHILDIWPILVQIRSGSLSNA